MQEPPIGKDNRVDYKRLLERYPWITLEKQDCILSPDSDGLLCGLFMNKFLGWKIRGFYDGKILVVEENIKPRECVFLDMEIYRSGVKSVGQHMVLYNTARIPGNWSNFDDCLSANNIRGYDAKHNFPQKYPLATIHLLLGVIASIRKIEIPTEAICPLLYSDGTFKNLFNYPDNCLSWLEFLHADNATSPLHSVFFNNHYSISSLMLALRDLFAELRLIGNGRRGGDKIKISNTRGALVNFDKKNSSFLPNTLNQAEELLRLLEKKTGWNYVSRDWPWTNLTHFSFSKGSIRPSQRRYDELMAKNPLSLAMTSGLAIEFSEDRNNIF